jgi:hypothetical protein
MPVCNGDAVTMQARFPSPLLAVRPTGIASCEHCRTVTWAGQAACACEFALLAVDETAVGRLCETTTSEEGLRHG